jgi:hypothetical protein
MIKMGAKSSNKNGEIEITEELIHRALYAAFDSTDAVRFLVTQDGTVIHFNRKAYENSILLHNKELKKGDNLFDFAADTVNSVENRLKKELARTFKGETFFIETEIKYNVDSNWFETEYCPVILNKQIIAASITLYDITERKNKELSQKQQLEDLKSSTQSKLQQTEFMVETMIISFADMISELKKKSPSYERLLREMEGLKDDVNRLRAKLAFWKNNI